MRLESIIMTKYERHKTIVVVLLMYPEDVKSNDEGGRKRDDFNIFSISELILV
jgi:hypothetical protein